MEDFSAIAARIAVSVAELRGCVILSRDGLVLGSHPSDDENLFKPAWLRFAALGDAEKGFVEFGDELWVYVRRGPYAAFAVSGATVRPGLLMDQLEQGLLLAESQRAKREALRIPEAPDAPKGKPRTSLHKAGAQMPEPAPVQSESPSAIASALDALQALEAAAATASKTASEPAPTDDPASPGDPATEHGEVDRFVLAQEFSRLLQSEPLQKKPGGDEDATT